MPTAHLYCRASTLKQDLGVEVQEVALLQDYERTLKPKGFDRHVLYKDKGESGAKDIDQRPSGRQMQLAADRGDILVFYRIDRWARSIRNALNNAHVWAQRGIAFRILQPEMDTSTPAGRLALNIMLAFAEFERELISARIREALARRTAEGRWCPRRWGFKVLKRVGRDRHGKSRIIRCYARDERMREIMAMIVKWYEQGLSFEQIAMQLWRTRDEYGKLIRGPRGGEYNHGDILRMYCAEVQYQALEKEMGRLLEQPPPAETMAANVPELRAMQEAKLAQLRGSGGDQPIPDVVSPDQVIELPDSAVEPDQDTIF